MRNIKKDNSRGLHRGVWQAWKVQEEADLKETGRQEVTQKNTQDGYHKLRPQSQKLIKN